MYIGKGVAIMTTCCEVAEDIGLRVCPRCGTRIFPDEAVIVIHPVYRINQVFYPGDEGYEEARLQAGLGGRGN